MGLVIHGYDLHRILQEIQTRSAQGLKAWIVTANGLILLTAKRQPAYWETLRQADFRFVDGSGPQLIGFLRGTLAKRVAGVELSEALAQLCLQKKWTLALVGGKDGIADKAAWELRKAYPELKVWAETGGMIAEDGRVDEAGEASLTRLFEYEPDVVLVAFGCPKQEYWIQKYKDRLPTVKVFMGVGGTLDFWAGHSVRAPLWMRHMGLEWLWRLIQEPWRWRRIWDTIVVFPIRALFG